MHSSAALRRRLRLHSHQALTRRPNGKTEVRIAGVVLQSRMESSCTSARIVPLHATKQLSQCARRFAPHSAGLISARSDVAEPPVAASSRFPAMAALKLIPRWLQDPAHQLSTTLEQLPRPRSVLECLELDLIGILEILEKDVIHLLANAGIEREDL